MYLKPAAIGSARKGQATMASSRVHNSTVLPVGKVQDEHQTRQEYSL